MSHKDMWIEEYERLREKFMEEGFSENEAARRAELMASDSLIERKRQRGETVCATCKNLYVVGKTDHWFRWLCYVKKREAEFNPVTGETVADPPYEACRHVNFGMCIHYEEGPNSLKPQSVQDYMERITNG